MGVLVEHVTRLRAAVYVGVGFEFCLFSFEMNRLRIEIDDLCRYTAMILETLSRYGRQSVNHRENIC